MRLGLLVFTAVTCVVIGDTAGQLLTQAGVAPVFVAWTRFAVAALVLLPFSGMRWPQANALLDWRVLARGSFIACGIVCILTALRSDPIANVYGAFFIGPIFAYVLAIVLLRERPTPARSLSVLVGFAGVLLVVKPGFGASWGMVFALAAGLFYGGYLVTTRVLAGAFQARHLLISQLLVGAVLLAPFGLGAPWPAFDANVAALLALSAGGSAVGNYLLVVANRHAEASLIAPLAYSQLISATAMGALVFGTLPDALTGLGLILIAGAGAAALWTRAPA